MPSVKVYVVEDDLVIATDLIATLESLNYEVIGSSQSGEDALAKLPDLELDLILLDIGLDGAMDGVDLAAQVNKLYDIPIIFLTSFTDQHTIDRVKVTKPAGYIVKPFDERDLQTNIELALYNFVSKDSVSVAKNDLLFHDQIFVKDNFQFKKLDISDILYAKADDNYTFIYTNETHYLVSSTLKVIETKFPRSIFVRIHRSYLINIKKIDSIGSTYVVIGDSEIPVGKSYKSGLMQLVNLI